MALNKMKSYVSAQITSLESHLLPESYKGHLGYGKQGLLVFLIVHHGKISCLDREEAANTQNFH